MDKEKASCYRKATKNNCHPSAVPTSSLFIVLPAWTGTYSDVLPYLNTELGGGDYIRLPASLTLHVHGKLITLHAREIHVNALRDEAEAALERLQKRINVAWTKLLVRVQA